MDDIIKIKESIKDSSLLIDGATETVKHEIKKPLGTNGTPDKKLLNLFLGKI